MITFLGWVVVMVGAKEERSNIQGKFSSYLETQAHLEEEYSWVGETEDALIKYKSPQLSDIFELGKYTRNKRKCRLNNGDFGNGC